MKYCYRIGYSTHEESDQVSMWHENKYTEEELDEIVCKAYVLSYLDETGQAFDMEEFYHSEEFNVFNSKYRISLQDCWKLVPEYLVSNFGFTKTQYECEFWVNGWANLGAEEEPSKESDTTKKVLRAIVEVERKWEK